MLAEFFVLGIIPGTQIQITFDMWLMISVIIAGCTMLWRSYRSELLQRIIITSEIFALTHRPLPERFNWQELLAAGQQAV